MSPVIAVAQIIENGQLMILVHPRARFWDRLLVVPEALTRGTLLPRRHDDVAPEQATFPEAMIHPAEVLIAVDV